VSTHRAGILGAALVLEHVPDLVRSGSKPSRELDRVPELERSLRTYEQALAYPPHQVFIGNARPEQLWEQERPWWQGNGSGARRGSFGTRHTTLVITGLSDLGFSDQCL